MDCGAVFSDRPKFQKYKAEISLKAMQLMGYDALNLGYPEFCLGKDFLKDTRSLVSFPYITSNLLYKGRRLPWTHEYIIKEIGGIKVAILGIANPDALEKIPDPEHVIGLDVIPPETALKRLLPEVRKKADLVILLSRLGVKQTIALAKNINRIDVTISSGDRGIFYAEAPGKTVILQTGSFGRALGLIKITSGENGAFTVDKRKYIPLDDSVSGDKKIEKLFENAFNAHRKQTAAQAKKQFEKEKKELMEGLNLSPEEFIKRHRKKQTENRGGKTK